jgi:hypothetical protein
MKYKQLLPVFLACLLIIVLFLTLDFFINESARLENLYVFVGVDAAYNDVDGIKRLVDEVKSYTNLFVIGNTGVTWNVTAIDEVCQYIYDRGLYFIVFTGPTGKMINQGQWTEDARARFGDRFLGTYAYDEVGGRQLDRDKDMFITEAANYTDAADKFVGNLTLMLLNNRQYVNSGNLPLFTSDYALYWFDYKAGYDVVLAEFGWNYSRQLNVALCRGAATVQNKNWGVMITWTYTNPPYIESGKELYDDLILAYNNGAKYILVFDANSDYTHGILKEEHLEALKKFWHYINHNPATSDALSDRVAYVLPKDYGYGFRGPNDKIWGLWEADALSNEICTNLNNLMEQYGTKLDIIYDDKTEPYNISLYRKLIFWNGTVYTIH